MVRVDSPRSVQTLSPAKVKELLALPEFFILFMRGCRRIHVPVGNRMLIAGGLN